MDYHAYNICNLNFIVHYHAITVPYRVGIYILSPQNFAFLYGIKNRGITKKNVTTVMLCIFFILFGSMR